MTNLNSYYDELDLNFDPAFASARRSLRGLVRVLISATVVTGVVLISTTAINNYNESTHLNAVGAAPVIRTEAGADKRSINFLASLESLLNYAQALRPSVPRQVDEPVEYPLRFSDAPTYPAVRGIEQGPIVLAERPPAATPELAAKAPVPTPATKPAEEKPALTASAAWRIQLISLSNQKDATAVSARLAQAHQDLLDGLTLHVQEAKLSKGTFYRVQTGPLANRFTAASLCNSLKSRNQDCLILAR